MSNDLTVTAGEIVFARGGEVLTDSLRVAEVFEKRHANVLQAIENLNCPPEFMRLNFRLANYTDGGGHERKCYTITKKGFVRLAMGFTGPKAARVKEWYIGEFKEQREQLIIPSLEECLK